MHLYKWLNRFTDVFISSIDEELISYEVRDKVTGNLVEPPRTVKYLINEISKSVHIDNREMPLEEFIHAYNILK